MPNQNQNQPNQNPHQHVNTADRILEELITSRGDTNRALAQQQEQIIQLTGNP